MERGGATGGRGLPAAQKDTRTLRTGSHPADGAAPAVRRGL
jgi:hypothetical protein